MSPLPHNRSGFASCPLNLTAGLWTVPFRRFCRSYQERRQSKKQAASLRFQRRLFFVFDFARYRRTLNLRRIALGVAAELSSRYTLRCSLQLGHPRVGLACTDVMHVFTAQLAFSLCGLLGFVKSSSHATTWSPLAITLAGFVPLLLLVLRLDKSAITEPQPYCVIASIRPQLLDGLRALCFCPINHHLVDLRVSAIPAPSLRTLYGCAGNSLPASSSSLFGYHALSFRHLLFSGFSASLNCCC